MRVSPLVAHATVRLPALTRLFSEPVNLSLMTVVTGGLVTLTWSAPHGIPIGQPKAISIVDAGTPNAITAATAVAVSQGLLVQITTAYGHDLTLNWNLFAKLSGFAVGAVNGMKQLVSVDGPNTFTVLVPSNVGLTAGPITMTGAEALIERLEQGIVGWHKVTATGTTTATFPTPPDVARSYTVPNPVAVSDVRVAGAINFDVAKNLYTRGFAPGATSQTNALMGKSWLFICPWLTMQLSKDRRAQTDALIERTAGSDYRRLLLDGYNLYVALPAAKSTSGARPSDLANGEVLAAMLRTFDGLKVPRAEFFAGDTYVHTLVQHGQTMGEYDYATYWHGFSVEAPVQLHQWDSILPFEITALPEVPMTPPSGDGPGSLGGASAASPDGPVAPTGSVAFRGLTFSPGIYHDTLDSEPLTATVPFV